MSDEATGAIVIAVFCFLGIIGGCSAGSMCSRRAMQDELVKSGYAEWYLDEKAEKQWRMKGGTK